MNNFNRYFNTILEQAQRSLGTLIGAKGGGEGGNWGGSLPKLISLLPMGNWQPTSLKRPRQSTKSGFMSDHYEGNKTAYAADFGLRTTFKNDTGAATSFAIQVAKNTGANVESWKPYVGKSFKYNTSDGFRVQIIWQSNVGGNHYDHVHVGVKKGHGTPLSNDAEYQDVDAPEGSLANRTDSKKENEGTYVDNLLASMKSSLTNMTDYSPAASRSALQNILSTTWGAIGKENLKKLQ
jgi:hypothetical protein